MSAARPLTMRQTAAALGLHYDTLRKRWPALVEAAGLPRPFLGHRWDAAAIEAWKARRSDALQPPPARPPPGPAAPIDAQRLNTDRAALAALRSA